MLAGTIAMLLLTMQTNAASGQSGTAPRAGGGRDDPDRMICRSPEPVLGSRVARRRICRTRAQWQAFEEDRQQLRRDIQNSSKDVIEQ